MHINSSDFRVREGAEVDLKKWPTRVDPVYETNEQYQELLGKHVKALSAQQELLYASDRYAVSVDFSGHGCGGKRRRDPARHVGSQPAGLPGVQLQASQRRGTEA